MIIALQTLIFFRESLLTALDRLLRPYYKRFSLVFSRSKIDSDDDESEEQVFSVYDDEKGVVFYPPVYAQRYAAVSDCLIDERWCGKLEKVVDLGYHDMSFVKYLKEVSGIKYILGVDIESIPLRCSSDLFGCEEYAPKRENPLRVTFFQGNAADPDYRLIGCDAVIAIEMIEHMLPHDLDRLVHTTFGFIKPWIAIFTTPNSDFNILFKSLERNGLRRLDHFFEWTREQFHDWCSNIVLRYPQYSVTCRGIGPGPLDTHHLGCCSQMALFISKDYHKQDDLNLDSLSLVADAPNPNNLTYIISNSNTAESYEENSIIPNNIQSYTQLLFSEKQSGMTLVVTSQSFSLNSLEYRDEVSQCDLDTEAGKNFLMFDDEQLCYNVVMPRRRVYNKVYEIEDINCRLNCTTLQVNKFSKTTQNLMAKNKIDSLVHTREVVDEIRHLTKVLNFNKDCLNQEVGPHVWANINWGDNAPYWNQYYKIVREYNYPFETKSEECRILDLITDEMNKLIDMRYEEEFCVEDNRIEIPLQHLMGVVRYITEDVDRVKDLLEWNGYEIVDDVVVHSRLVVDNTSVASHEEAWSDNDISSDWDTTDCHSTSLSDGSNIIPDYHGRCLRRALDNKLRKLRSMLTADEDITTELDRVVCRLMKLALHTSRDRQNPPPMRWLQYKLLDLLTLTENTIDRRKRHFIETYSMIPINYDIEDKPEKNIALEKFNEDNTTNKIVDKYRHLVQPTVLYENIKDFPIPKYLYSDTEMKDYSSTTSTDHLKEFDLIDRQSHSFVDPELIHNEDVYKCKVIDEDEMKFDRVRHWIKEDNIEVVPYPNHNIIFDNSSGDTDHTTDLITYVKYNERLRPVTIYDVNDLSVRKKCVRKVTNGKRIVKHGEHNTKKMKWNKIKIMKKLKRKWSNCGNFLRKGRVFDETSKWRKKYRTAYANPIPESLIKLCLPELNSDEYKTVDSNLNHENSNEANTVSETEQSYLIDIVMEGIEETIALRRTIATDTSSDLKKIENEILCKNHEARSTFCEKYEPTQNVESQTIFLNDINEPSTSKGVRHRSMDVQCGPDNTAKTYSMLSATTSYTKIPKLIEIGVNISDLYNVVETKSTKSGNYTENEFIKKTISPNIKSIGIRIQDSNVVLLERNQSGTMTEEVKDAESVAINGTGLLEAVSDNLKTEDSGAEFCCSIGSILKNHYVNINDPNDEQISLYLGGEVPVTHKLSSTKYVKPMLHCGGVHIHSYKDKTVSEDVVYQGEWQQYRPPPLVKKKSLTPDVLNKVIQPLLKRNNVVMKNKKPKTISNNKETNYEFQKRTQSRRNVLHEPRQISKEFRNDKIININKTSKSGTIINITKITSKHTTGLPTSKSNYAPMEPTILSCNDVKKDSNKQQQRPLLKNYIPRYLRKRGIKLSTPIAKNLNEHIDIIKTTKSVNKKRKPINAPLLGNTKTKENKTDLLNFYPKTSGRMNYLVFRNEISSKNSASSEESTKNEEKISTINNGNKSLQCSPSQNSSTCSSPNSVATIRFVSKNPKSVSAKNKLILSQKNNKDDCGPETSTPSRLKKVKRINSCKSTKISDNKNFENKENLSQNFGLNCKENDEIDRKVYKASNRNVFIAQLNADNQSFRSALTNFSKYKPQSSNFKSPSANNIHLNYNSDSPSVTNEKKLLPENEIFVYNENINLENGCTNENVDSLTEPQISSGEVIQINNTVDNNFGYCTKTNINTDENSADTRNTMKQLLEEILTYLETPFDNHVNVESESAFSFKNNTNHHQNSSTISFGKIATSNGKLNSSLNITQENDFNDSFNTIPRDTSILSLTDINIDVTDLELLSFKSITSETKLSESYFDGCDFNILTPQSNSVREIFERKDEPLTKIPEGALAIQAFSGFSVNGEPFIGDQPDSINFVDSETGSLAIKIARQTTSEELFVSGRSSDTYESCVIIDEDTVVPNWLFNIISQQQSVPEVSDALNPDVPMSLDDPIPFAEPVFDANGNTDDPGIGVGTGAGDGRGMHSNHSQDSSGRGTSLSSSETSSGEQSEAIIIDAATFLRQFEPIEEGDTSAAPVLTNETDQRASSEVGITGEQIVAGNDRRQQFFSASSDIDADISSLNTDDASDSSG